MRGAGAGLVAAAAWLAAESVLRRVFGTDGYSVPRLLGRPLTRRRWRAAGTALHLLNGAAAGIAFRHGGLAGWRAGLIVFQLENVAAWPAMALADRVHPDRGGPDWPPLFANPRVFAHEAAGHAVFGAVLGLLAAENS